jgi:hypothetical protein
MRTKRNFVMLAVVASIGALFLVGSGQGQALAYGRADQPIAQVELSGNCDNPSFPFCAPPPDGVGTGGIWIWAELDQGGTGDVTGSVCDHTYAGTGPHMAGALPVNGEVTWSYTNLANGLAAGGEFLGKVDPGDSYYLMTVQIGGEPASFLIPTTTGHYSFQPTNGVSIQLQVAP